MFTIDADLSSIDTGVWRDFGGSKFLIAHISNNNFQRELARLQQPHRRKIESGSMDPIVSKQILCQAMSKYIVLGWDKVVNKAGQPVPYSSDAAYQALLNDPELRDFVADVGQSMANFRTEEVEAMGKG